MTVIRQQDFIDSIEDSLQFISYYHPLDYVKAVEAAYNREESQAAKAHQGNISKRNIKALSAKNTLRQQQPRH